MITLDIVTPSRSLIEGVKVPDVRLPGEKGEMMVLAGHTPLLTILNAGLLSFTENGKNRLFAVSYGFAEVSGDRVMVLAETCEESQEIDVERAKTAQRKAEEVLRGQVEQGKFKKFQTKLQRALIRQHVGRHG